MSDVSTLNRTALMDMLAVCQEVVIAHASLFDDFSLAECKEVVVSNIRPLPFRALITDYASRYMNSLFTFDDLVRLIVKEFDAEMFANNRMKAHGITSLANSAQTSTAPRNLNTVTTLTVPKIVTCYNCQQPGHSATVCTALCRFHNLHCANKFACYRHNTEAKKPKTSKKANVTVASDTTVSVAQCLTSYTADSQFTPYPLSNPDVGIVDTGCNTLCVPDESLFDSLVKLDSPEFIKVADGKLVRIEGEGKICDRIAKHVPDFDRALVPIDDEFTTNSYGIIDTGGDAYYPPY
jgi:hypothetical protein